MPAELFLSNDLNFASDTIPTDASVRVADALSNRLDIILPLLAKYYNPDWMKAPVIARLHDDKEALEETLTGDFTIGYAQKLWIKKEGDRQYLWGNMMGTKEGVGIARSGKYSTGFSIGYDFFDYLNEDGTITKIPYLLHIVACSDKQNALPMTSSLSQAFTKNNKSRPIVTLPVTEGQLVTFTAYKEDGIMADEKATEDAVASAIDIINREALASLHQGVADAIGGGGDVQAAKQGLAKALADARTYLDTISPVEVAPTPDEEESVLEEMQTEIDGLPAMEEKKKEEEQVAGATTSNGMCSDREKYLRIENIKLRRLLAKQLPSVFTAEKMKVVDRMSADSLGILLDTLASTTRDESLTPTSNKFVMGAGIPSPSEPKTVAELEKLGKAGYVALLRKKGFEGEIDADREYTTKLGILTREEAEANGK